jgi:hypothetical protein
LSTVSASQPRIGATISAAGGGADRAVPGLDGQPGPPGQDVVEVQGALVRRGVGDLGAQVVLAAGQRVAEERSASMRSRISVVRMPCRISIFSIRSTCRPDSSASAARRFHIAW